MSRVPGTYDRTRRVRTLFVVPSPSTPGMTERERLAVTLRRDATVSGVCVCGARLSPIRRKPGTVAKATMQHEPDCPAAGPHIDALMERLGDQLEFETVLVDLEVAA